MQRVLPVRSGIRRVDRGHDLRDFLSGSSGNLVTLLRGCVDSHPQASRSPTVSPGSRCHRSMIKLSPRGQAGFRPGGPVPASGHVHASKCSRRVVCCRDCIRAWGSTTSRPSPIGDPTTAAKPVASQVRRATTEAIGLAGVAKASGWAASDGGGSSRSGVGGPWSGGTTLSGLPGLPQGNYVIVPETTAPHHTFATAQDLPNLHTSAIVGTLGSGDSIDLYRLTLSAGVEGLNFGLMSDHGGPVAIAGLRRVGADARRVVVERPGYDDPVRRTGHPAGGFDRSTSASPRGIRAEQEGCPRGSIISYGSAVSRRRTPRRSSRARGRPARLRRILAATALPLSAATGSGGPAIERELSEPRRLRLRTDGGNLPVAVGSPATRSAGPSGGLLSEGDPAPAVPSDFNAAVNKEWDEPTPTAIHNPTCRQGRADGVRRGDRKIRMRWWPSTVPAGSRSWAPWPSDIGDGNPTTFAGDLATTPDRADGEFQVVARPVPAEPEVPMTDGDIDARSPNFRGDRRWTADGRSPRSPPAWEWRRSSP